MTGETMVVANGSFDAAAALSTLARHEIDGLTATDLPGRTHRRVVELEGGPVRLDLRFCPAGIRVSAPAAAADPTAIESLVRYWFDLDSDIEAIDRSLGASGPLAGQVVSRPGVRITRHPDGWEGAVLTVLGQQVSVRAARTFGARLVAAYGEAAFGMFRFPPPEKLAAQPVERLREAMGITGGRARTIHAVANRFAAGSVSDPKQLSGLPGIGPWTVACLSIRAGTAADEFPATDAVLRRALDGVDAREADRIALGWKPFRSYAAVRLWTAATTGEGEDRRR